MALKEVLIQYTADASGVEKALSKGEAAAKKAESGFASVGKAIAAFFAVSKIKDFTQGLIDSGAEVQALAQKFDLSSGAFQQWRNAADASGVNAEKFNVALTTLAKNTGEAAKAGSPFAETFKAVGVTLKDSSGKAKPFATVLRETGLALAKIPDVGKRTALSMQLMGEGGAAMGGLFRDGAKGLDELLGLTEEYGGALSDEMIAKAGEARKSQVKLNIAWESAKSRLGEVLLPMVTKGAKALADFGAAFSRAAQGSQIIQAGLIVLGAVLAGLAAKSAIANAAIIGPWLMWAAAIAFAILAVDDLLVTLKGGDSTITRFVDKLDNISLSKMSQRMKEAQDKGGLVAQIEEIFSSVGFVVVNWFVQTGQLFKTFGIVLWADIVEALSGAAGAISAKMQAWGAIIWGILPTWMQAGLSIAGGLISGLVTGIVAGAGKVTKAVKDAAKGAIDGAKDLLGIKSPSTVFRGIGRMIPAGQAEGILAGAPMVARAAESALGPQAVSQAALGRPSASVSQGVTTTINMYGVPGGEAAGRGAAAGVRAGVSEANDGLLAALVSA